MFDTKNDIYIYSAGSTQNQQLLQFLRDCLHGATTNLTLTFIIQITHVHIWRQMNRPTLNHPPPPSLLFYCPHTFVFASINHLLSAQFISYWDLIILPFVILQYP